MKLSHDFASALALTLLLGCSSVSSDDAASSTDGCVSPSCQASAAGGTQAGQDLIFDSGAGGAIGGTTSDASSDASVCAIANAACDPDDEYACSGATGGAGGASAQAGSTNTSLACRITFSDSEWTAQCATDGTGTDGASCASDIDCASGYGCVNDSGSPLCRHYCCGSDASCSTSAYCGERILQGSVESAEPFTAKVCLPVVECSFEEPYPCPADQTCTCPAGTTCGVVRDDGATACVVPGTGLEGEACPCAAGHVCSDATGTCMKTCNLADTTSNAEDCTQGACQDSASLPDGVGICVSSVALT